MIHYLYDGTFEGLLTVIAGALKNYKEITNISSARDIQPDLFTEFIEINTDPALAEEFFQLLSKKITKITITDICYCFLSEKRGIEMLILNYIRLLLENGNRASNKVSDTTVFQIQRISEQVSHEILRFYGFVRFRKLKNGIYFAAIEPDYNIVQFLAPHFTARFADQQWLIHDRKRDTGIYYDGSQCTFIPLMEITPEAANISTSDGAGRESPVLDPEELNYQNIWNQYYQQAAITERENKKVRNQRMPVRYWRYLVEQVKK